MFVATGSALEMEKQMFPGHKVWGRGEYPGREAVSFLSFVFFSTAPFPGRQFAQLDLSPSPRMVLQTWDWPLGPPYTPLYLILEMCLCLMAECLNRMFFCLGFCYFNFYVFQPFKNHSLCNWELSTALYTQLLETEFLFGEVQSLSGFNLVIEREKCISEL